MTAVKELCARSEEIRPDAVWLEEEEEEKERGSVSARTRLTQKSQLPPLSSFTSFLLFSLLHAIRAGVNRNERGDVE